VNEATVTGGVRRFAANPRFPGSFVYTDLTGMLRFAPPGSPEGPMSDSPFFEGFSPGDANNNKNFVRDVGWAPNGQWFFFIIDPPGGQPNIDAGVWFWQPGMTDVGRTFTLARDCLPGYASCDIVSGRPANAWKALKAEFSPGSTLLLITYNLPEEGRQGVAVRGAVTDASYANNAPDIHRYDTAWWLGDGRIIASGRRPSDGRVVIAITDQFLNNEEVIFDATGAGLWMQDAAQRPDGTIVAFGAEGSPGGPVRLYAIQNGAAVALSGPIGNAAPSNIEWSLSRNEAVVTAGGTQYRVDANNGGVGGVSLRSDAALTVGANPPDIAYPSGVLPGSRYVSGQQVQFIGAENRNVRALPSTSFGTVIERVLPGEFVAIIAGPYQGEGYEWWYISNARTVQGWIASTDEGVSLLSP
jgi:hypothetical protein